jgi:DNA-binding PadR family transcriptional regulator
MAVLRGASAPLTSERDLPTLAYALLSLLSREPMTGYRLAARMRDPIGHFWEARHSQIYPELARLEAMQLVTSTSEQGPGPRAKKTYRITDAGLEGLRAWVGRPTRRWGGRDELILKVFASWVASPSETLKLLREATDYHAAQLAGYLGERAAPGAIRAAGMAPNTPQFASYVTLRRGIGYERGRLAWCRWLIRKLEAAEAGKAAR